MALSADAFLTRRHKGPRCGVSLLLEALDEKDRAVLAAAIADPNVQAAVIARVLADDGHRLAEGTISKHRRKGCACDS